jgi:hypothetical protein
LQRPGIAPRTSCRHAGQSAALSRHGLVPRSCLPLHDVTYPQTLSHMGR